MTKTYFKLFFLTLLLLSLAQPLFAQESLVLPYKAADKTYFFFAVEKGQFMIPLRNNSFLDVPTLYIYAMNPYVNNTKRINLKIEILNITKVNQTIKYSTLESNTKAIIITDDFEQSRIDLPIYSQNNIILRLTYLNLVIVFTYKVNPLYLKSENQIILQRIIGYVSLAVFLIISVILAMYLGRKILDKIVYFPGDPFIILVVSGILGFMAYSYLSNLQYLDPATYVSLSSFLVNYYNILLLLTAIFVTTIASLYIFRKKPDQILLLKFEWNKVKGPESKELDVETKVIDILPGNITAPTSISHLILYLLGIRQKLKFKDEWHIKDKAEMFKKIYMVNSDFKMDDMKLKLEVNWKHLAFFTLGILLIASLTPLGLTIGAIIVIVELYLTRDREKKKKKGEEEIIEKVPGVKLFKIKNREIEVKLAPKHYERLFKHFYDLLSKKALLDEAYQARKQVTILLSEKEIERIEALRDYTDTFLTKFRKLLESDKDEGERD